MSERIKPNLGRVMIKDLGNMKGPVLLFGGPYSNLQATQALVEEVKKHNIPLNRVICTGDMVAYCGSPKETVELMQESGFHIIQGNCEENLANAINDCGCGFDEGSACAVSSDQWYNLAQRETTPAQKAWMGALPHRIEFTLNGKRFHVLHGSNTDISEFIFPSTSLERKAVILDEIACDVVVAGHSGIPFTQLLDGKAWHNPGVVGLPPNDGTSRVWYSLVKAEDGDIVFEHCALTYDHSAAAQRMRALGLSDYAQALLDGLYPSLSVLPDREKNETGIEMRTMIKRLN